MTQELLTVQVEGSPNEFVTATSHLYRAEMNRMLVGVGHLIPPWLVALTAVLFIGTAAILGLSCPSAEELEDWSIHYHRDRHGDQGPRT